jgi:vacuolar-type H+-ATPase subunit E/Vma4
MWGLYDQDAYSGSSSQEEVEMKLRIRAAVEKTLEEYKEGVGEILDGLESEQEEGFNFRESLQRAFVICKVPEKFKKEILKSYGIKVKAAMSPKGCR